MPVISFAETATFKKRETEDVSGTLGGKIALATSPTDTSSISRVSYHLEGREVNGV